MSDKIRYSRGAALAVARELCGAIEQACEPDLLKVCGSLRRRRETVGDVELVYVPKVEQIPEAADLLGNTGRRLAVPAEGEEPKAYPAILDELEARPQLRQRGTTVDSVPSELEQLRMTLTGRLSDLKRKGKKAVVREVKPANCEIAQVDDLEPALAGEGEPF